MPQSARFVTFAIIVVCMWVLAPQARGYYIEGPTGSGSSVEGTFRVTLNHSVAGWDPDLDCFFTNALINIPIVGDGFVVSNVQVSNAQAHPRDEAGLFYNDDNMPVVYWLREFYDEANMLTRENEISGELFSFDVHFGPGVTEGSYTVGQEEISAGWGATCFDGDTPIIAVDGIYLDYYGGRTFSIPLLGDYNEDGTVGAADYTIWRDTFGSTTDLRADGNEDGTINAADYTLWRDNFGGAAGSVAGEGIEAAPIPEPTTLACLGLGVLLLGRRRRAA